MLNLMGANKMKARAGGKKEKHMSMRQQLFRVEPKLKSDDDYTTTRKRP